MNSLHIKLLNFLSNTKYYIFSFLKTTPLYFKNIIYSFLTSKFLIFLNKYNFYSFENDFYILNKPGINFVKDANFDFNLKLFFNSGINYYFKKIKKLFLANQYKDIINSLLSYSQMYFTYFEECLFGEVEYVFIKIFDIERDFFLKNFKLIHKINLLNFFDKKYFLS
jgi:hypothetical protein